MGSRPIGSASFRIFEPMHDRLSTATPDLGLPVQSETTDPQAWQWSNFLDHLGRFGVQLGLERMTGLLERLGQPQQGIPVIHVAGTNGKGSVCAMLSHILWAAGYRVGRYSSPHLVSWRERIWVNGQWIPMVEWSRLLYDLAQILKSYPPDQECPTQFEVSTAAAWLYFQAQKVDIVVLEVGLGGRLDATRVGIEPVATIITSIGMDHWQRLGDTLPQIAAEKAAIACTGIPMISAPQVPEVLEVICRQAQQVQAPLQVVDPVEWALPDLNQRESNHTEFGQPGIRWKGETYPLPLRGNVQLINSALALATVEVLRQQGYAITSDQIRQGLAQTQWPGRLQTIELGGQTLLLDGAHNLPAAVALRQYLDQTMSGSICWFVAMLETKDAAGILKMLLRPGDQVYTLPINDHLGIPPQMLATIAEQAQPALTAVTALGSLHQWQELLAHWDGLTLPKEPQTLPQNLVVCGSLYLIGQIMQECLGWELAH